MSSFYYTNATQAVSEFNMHVSAYRTARRGAIAEARMATPVTVSRVKGVIRAALCTMQAHFLGAVEAGRAVEKFIATETKRVSEFITQATEDPFVAQATEWTADPSSTVRELGQFAWINE